MEAQSTINHRVIRIGGSFSNVMMMGLWFSATVVNYLLAWCLVPLVVDRLPVPAVLIYWAVMVLGAGWQVGITLWMVHRLEGSLQWSGMIQVTRLGLPLDGKSGKMQGRILWRGLRRWWLVGLMMGITLLIAPILFISRRYLPMSIYTTPLLVWPAYSGLLELTSPEFYGQWWMTPIVLIGWAVLAFSEELFFRGLLLPELSRRVPKRDCITNALFFSLYSLYQFWSIPFRFLEGWILARAAKTYRSTWMAFVVRGVEGIGVGLLVLLGITSQPLTASTRQISFPTIANRPGPTLIFRGQWSTIPTYNPNNTSAWQINLRGVDLSGADLSNRASDLAFADFDTRTFWPTSDRLPPGFDPASILEMGKNPGLGLHSLHDQGITGQGVGVAVIDQALLTEHVEYADRLRWYEELPGYPSTAQMHGSAVSSLLVGKTIGVAPQADLYFISGTSNGLSTLWAAGHDYAQSIRRILQINEALPAERKIRVISMSVGWLPSIPGYEDVNRAVREAEAAGMMVVNTGYATGMPEYTLLAGLGRDMTANPDDFLSYGPGIWWANSFFAGGFHNSGLWVVQGHQVQTLLFPMDSRTMASETGANDYFFNRNGGQSWVVPYIAGLYALAAQMDPAITPDQFWQAVIQTGEILSVEHNGQQYTLGKAVHPVELIDRLRK